MGVLNVTDEANAKITPRAFSVMEDTYGPPGDTEYAGGQGRTRAGAPGLLTTRTSEYIGYEKPVVTFGDEFGGGFQLERAQVSA